MYSQILQFHCVAVRNRRSAKLGFSRRRYQHAEEYLQEKYEKIGLKLREYIDLIPEWICEKNGITNIIEIPSGLKRPNSF